MCSPLFYSHFYWRVSQTEEQETKYFKVWYGKVILLNSFFIRLIWKWINMYLITWNNLLYYRSALVYTIFYLSGKSNFWQICARSDVIFQSKKDLHILFSINNTYIRNRIWTRKFVFYKKKHDCNIFNHLFAIHIIIKSQGLISFLNLCVFVMMANTQLDDGKYSHGVFVDLKKSFWHQWP